MASLLFPLQFERQYSGPLDVNQVFNTTSERNNYLSSPLRYGGQIVSDLETDKVYVLNSSEDAWIEIGTGGGGTSGYVRTLTSPTLTGNPVNFIVAVTAVPTVQEEGILYVVVDSL
jgi:hypothetical protein